MTFADAVFILTEGSVQTPVQIIFDVLMGSDDFSDLSDIHGQTGNEVASFAGYLISDFTDCRDHGKGFEPFPLGLVFGPFDVVGHDGVAHFSM
uniref:Uncharacterized protein n=1 Tax=Desulfatirhabdium butyrativorans TaxID=340467 RepID=A0A7C4RTV5_9BACT